MELDMTPNRLLTGLVVHAITGTPAHAPVRRGPYAPPAHPRSGPPREDLRADEVAHLCHSLLNRLLIGADHAVGIYDELAPDVTLWTPSRFASSSLAVLESLLSDDTESSPLTDTIVVVLNSEVASPRVVIEWRFEGRFTRSWFIDDDLLVEPTGQLVETAGTFVVTFGPDGVVAMHLYHDALALLEQLLARWSPQPDGPAAEGRRDRGALPSALFLPARCGGSHSSGVGGPL